MRIAGGEIFKGTVPSRPECASLLLLNCYGAPLILAAILSIDAFSTKPS
jgi:hypothetical protein